MIFRPQLFIVSLSEHIEEALESVGGYRKDSIHGFGNTGRFRSSNEEQQDGQNGDAQGKQIGLAFARHFIITEETQADSPKEGNNQAGNGEDSKEQVGHDKGNEEDRQENEWEIVSNLCTIHVAAHIVQPVAHIEAKEPGKQERKKDDLFPAVGEAIAVLAEPPEENTHQKTKNSADDIVKAGRNEFHDNHADSGKDGTDDDPFRQFSGRSPLIFRHICPPFVKDFCHEDKKENSQSSKRVYKDTEQNEENREENPKTFEEMKFLEIQLFILRINREAHKYQVSQHDAYRLYGVATRIQKGTEYED